MRIESTDIDVIEGTRPGFYVWQRMAGSPPSVDAWVRASRYVVMTDGQAAIEDARKLAAIVGIDYRVTDETGQVWAEVEGSSSATKRRGVDYY